MESREQIEKSGIAEEDLSPASATVYTDGKNTSIFCSWERPQEPPQGWELAGMLYAVPRHNAWAVKARMSEKYTATMEQAISRFQAQLREKIAELNGVGLGLKDLPAFTEKQRELARGALSLQMLERDSRVMALAYYDTETDKFLFLPEADRGSSAFNRGMEDANNKGAKLVAVVAWMKEAGENGEALFEYQLMPGATEEMAERAKAAFRVRVVEGGLQTGLFKTWETGHS
jgi:hypothetical protein